MLSSLLLFISLQTANAGTLSSVTMPDTVTVGGQTLVLNGLGLREKYFFDIYVGGLYLPAKTTSSTSAIGDDVPKRLQMTFIYSAVTKAQIVETFEENLAKQSDAAAVKDRFDTLYSYCSDVAAGDSIIFDYVPGTGTTVTVKGKVMGTIAGVDFMKSLWTVYLGASPPTKNLKTGMMGG